MSSLRDKANLNSKKNKLQFCPYCGARLVDGARFCTVCGSEIIINQQEEYSYNQSEKENQNQEEYSYTPNFQTYDTKGTSEKKNNTQKTGGRETVYEGKLHKCPNCGELLDSYTMRCPTCGYEIRDARSVSSVKELADKLEKISAQKMDNKGILFHQERLEEFNKEKAKEKASLIKNFTIPNTKEDILEFVILASTNINSNSNNSNNDDADKEVDDAWIAKLEQAYRKAEATMSGEPEFDQIKEIYDKKMRGIKNRGMSSVLFIIGIIDFLIFDFGLLFSMDGSGLGILLVAISILIFIVIIVVVLRAYISNMK